MPILCVLAKGGKQYDSPVAEFFISLLQAVHADSISTTPSPVTTERDEVKDPALLVSNEIPWLEAEFYIDSGLGSVLPHP